MVAVCGGDLSHGGCMCVCVSGVIRVKVAVCEVIRVMVAVCLG